MVQVAVAMQIQEVRGPEEPMQEMQQVEVIVLLALTMEQVISEVEVELALITIVLEVQAAQGLLSFVMQVLPLWLQVEIFLPILSVQQPIKFIHLQQMVLFYLASFQTNLQLLNKTSVLMVLLHNFL